MRRIESRRWLHLLWSALLLVTSVRAPGSESPLLSKTDPGYAFIEKAQRLYCAKRPSHQCNFDFSVCKQRVEGLWRQLNNEEVPASTLSRLCDRVSTEFEIPGTHEMLRGYFKDVDQTAQLL